MQRKKKSKTKSPLIRLVGLEAAVVATGLVGSPGVVAAPGDLDPSFGDVGRQSGIALPSYYSSLWSVDVQADDSVLFGGGGEFEYYTTYEDDFLGRLLPNGAPDASFAAAALTNTVVYDTMLQPDGKVVAVGMARQTDGRTKLVLFRLRPDGSLDPEFGLGGQVLISDGTASRESGYSVLVEPDGRIVVAGQRGYSLLVARLRSNGALDPSFGTAGVFVGTEVASPIRIASAPAGGYRIAAQFPSGGMGWACGVAALSAAGVADAAFGSGGYAAPQSPGGGSTYCTSMAVQADGRVLLGGNDDYVDGYVARLHANGDTDTGFNAGIVAGRFNHVSALAVGTTGSIFVAGTDRTGFSGALVVRLLADGALDPLFGRAGASSVNLTSRRATFPVINDMQVAGGGRLVLGGNSNDAVSAGAFVARLLGDAGGPSPGVLGISQQRVLGTEQGVQARVSVRRTGGSAGSVAVTYATRDFPMPGAAGANDSPGERATGGADYTATTGRLTWADGDVSEREILVPIGSDAIEEKPEFFEVVLDSPEGGADLGAFGGDVEITGAHYPVGDITIESGEGTVNEGGEAYFGLQRNFYGQGKVSVTVRVAAGSTATAGKDFYSPGSSTWQDVVVTWADGEIGYRPLPVRVTNDGVAESAESITLELVSPTGGVALGDLAQATVQISASTAPPPPPKTNSGGGSFGWLGAMLLGLWGTFRRR